jgi:hypothetical protein
MRRIQSERPLSEPLPPEGNDLILSKSEAAAFGAAHGTLVVPIDGTSLRQVAAAKSVGHGLSFLRC